MRPETLRLAALVILVILIMGALGVSYLIVKNAVTISICTLTEAAMGLEG